MSFEYLRVRHAGRSSFARRERDGDQVELLQLAPWLGAAAPTSTVSSEAVELLAPVAPSKILCVAKNYRAHAAEMSSEVPKEPMLFFKPPSSLLAPGGTVLLPPESSRVDYEAELGVVIGSRCRRVSAAEAPGHIFGYTVLCDVTARDIQKSEKLWTRGKGFDTFCPTGPAIVPSSTLPLEAASKLRIQLRQSDEVRQDDSTANMVFSISEVISYASQFCTLEPGDLIATGTPEGVGPLQPGNHVEISIEALGTLMFEVEKDEAQLSPLASA